MTRTRWMFGFQRRLLRRWEWLRLMPKPGFFLQISQTEDIVLVPRNRGSAAGRGKASTRGFTLAFEQRAPEVGRCRCRVGTRRPIGFGQCPRSLFFQSLTLSRFFLIPRLPWKLTRRESMILLLRCATSREIPRAQERWKAMRSPLVTSELVLTVPDQSTCSSGWSSVRDPLRAPSSQAFFRVPVSPAMVGQQKVSLQKVGQQKASQGKVGPSQAAVRHTRQTQVRGWSRGGTALPRRAETWTLLAQFNSGLPSSLLLSMPPR